MEIKGYRKLSEAEIALINDIKAAAELVGFIVEKLRTVRIETKPKYPHDGSVVIEVADPRWVSIGATQLQQGFMALARSVAKPTTF